jgi:hypothetical protein
MPTFNADPSAKNQFVKNESNDAPSYTDRILIKNNTTCKIKITDYESRDDILGSDHRPVQMVFKVKHQQP